MYSVAIVEDEKRASTLLIDYLTQYGNENGVQFAAKVFDYAEDFLASFKGDYDIVFMDIELKGMNGMECAKRLRQLDGTVCLIFITNMAQYAIKGYEVDATDYFVKPFLYSDLKLRLNRILIKFKDRDKTITIKYEGKVIKLKCSDVFYIETFGHTLIYHTREKGFSLRGLTIKELEAELAPFGFSRCNNSMLVNLKHCTDWKGDEVTVNGEILTISRGRKKQFMQDLANAI